MFRELIFIFIINLSSHDYKYFPPDCPNAFPEEARLHT